MVPEGRSGYPVQLQLAGWPVLVVGGGMVAARKVQRLLASGAVVTIVAPRLVPELEALNAASGAATRGGAPETSAGARGAVDATAPGVEWRQRAFAPGDVGKARLVFAATDSEAVNRTVAEVARAAGVLVNVADDPVASDFHLPALVQRGDLQVAIATGGRAPFLARRLRERWERQLGPEWEDWVAAAARFRAEVRRRIPDPASRERLHDRFAVETLPDGADLPRPCAEETWRRWIEATIETGRGGCEDLSAR
ncbi:MAG: bifunctional precorrin-2 dehydrogenase/sirohydrochlorin ferrochelatase [Candidatus Krumholzibacteriia bacterium]